MGTNETTQQYTSKECLGTICVLHCRVIHMQSCVLSSTLGLYETLSTAFKTPLVRHTITLSIIKPYSSSATK